MKLKKPKKIKNIKLKKKMTIKKIKMNFIKILVVGACIFLFFNYNQQMLEKQVLLIH